MTAVTSDTAIRVEQLHRYGLLRVDTAAQQPIDAPARFTHATDMRPCVAARQGHLFCHSVWLAFASQGNSAATAALPTSSIPTPRIHLLLLARLLMKSHTCGCCASPAVVCSSKLMLPVPVHHRAQNTSSRRRKQSRRTPSSLAAQLHLNRKSSFR